MTKERPIIFSAESVRAILDGRKTQTRRVAKTGEEKYGWTPCRPAEWYTSSAIDRDGMLIPGKEVFGVYNDDGDCACPCPYGAPGDKLWVKEKWLFTALSSNDCDCAVGYSDGTQSPTIDIFHECDDETRDRYFREDAEDCKKAGWLQDADGIFHNPNEDDGTNPARWRSPLFMPRWASRLTLEIVNVRCERLNDISDDDYHAEGYDVLSDFVETWDKLNSKRGCGWYSNPWVWILSFKKVEEKGDQ